MLLGYSNTWTLKVARHGTWSCSNRSHPESKTSGPSVVSLKATLDWRNPPCRGSETLKSANPQPCVSLSIPCVDKGMDRLERAHTV